MPNTKISQLTESFTPAASAETVVVDASANAKVTLTNLVKAAIGGNTAVALGLNAVAKSGALSDLTGAGTMASQNASGVSITGGTVTGITDLAIADGGTGASTAAAAVTALGLDYASTNTVSTLVKRDASGNFSAGTITAALTGTASLATLATTATNATSATKSTNLANGVSGSIPYQTGANLTGFTAAGTDLQVLISKGTAAPQWVNQNTIASGLADATQNWVWAGPASGSVAGPSAARALVAADVPTLNQNTTGTAAGLSTTLVAASGGTGQSSYAVGDLLYASTTTALSKLASAAVGNVLHSGGAGVAPSYSKVVLTADVSGALPLINGGTGVAAASASAALTALLPSQATAAGKNLQSDGTSASWVAGAGAGTLTSLVVTNSLGGITATPTTAVTSGAVTIGLSGTLLIGSGGTGATTAGAALTALSGQPLANTLTKLAALTPIAADKVPYFNNANGTFATASLTGVARDFLALDTKAGQSSYIAATAPFSTVALDPCGRLSSLSNNADNPADNANITQLFYVPYNGNVVMLWDGTSWVNRTLTTITISLTGLAAATGYDVFIYWNSGTSAVVAETVAWSAGASVVADADPIAASSSNPNKYAVTRATALTTQNNRFVKNAEPTKLYVGSFHTTNTAGQTADTLSQRLVANQYNRIRKRIKGSQSIYNYMVGGWFTTPGKEGLSPTNSGTQAAKGCTMPPLNGAVWVMGASNTEVEVESSCFVLYQAGQSNVPPLLYTGTHLFAGQAQLGSGQLAYLLDYEVAAWGGGAALYNTGQNVPVRTNRFCTNIASGLVGYQPVIQLPGGATVGSGWQAPIVFGIVNC